MKLVLRMIVALTLLAAKSADAVPLRFSWEGTVGDVSPEGTQESATASFSFVIDPDLAVSPLLQIGVELFDIGTTYGFQDVPVVATLNGNDYVVDTSGANTFRLQIVNDATAIPDAGPLDGLQAYSFAPPAGVGILFGNLILGDATFDGEAIPSAYVGGEFVLEVRQGGVTDDFLVFSAIGGPLVVTPDESPTPIPLPTTMPLLVAALGLLGLVRRARV